MFNHLTLDELLVYDIYDFDLAELYEYTKALRLQFDAYTVETEEQIEDLLSKIEGGKGE